MLEAIKDAGAIVATFGGVWLAWRGLETWRKEVIGKRDIEIAEATLVSFYKAEENLKALRSPMVWWFEGQSRSPQEEESEDTERRRNALYAPLERLKNQNDFWIEFYASRHRARVAFGQEALAPFNDMDLSVREFRAAADTRYQHMYRDEQGLRQDTRREFESVIWQLEGDEIARRTAAAIEKIEGICLPKARWQERRRWWGEKRSG